MEIFERSACDLLSALNAGELSSLEIIEALIQRHDTVNPLVNAIVQPQHDVARTQAKLADEQRAAGTAGPLSGLPMTIKENFIWKGTQTTIGVQAWKDKRFDSNAVLLEQLRGHGAVFLGKTNVPQLLLAQETENAIWGLTKNPWDLGRSPGGSSGGESAAIASGLSPWGLGTDIGGSIRIPCHFTGLAGLKPTLDRWSNRGSMGAVPGQELVRSQAGPMARRVEDLTLLWNTLDPVAMSKMDPFVPPLPTNSPDTVDLSGLTIGFYDDDTFVRPVGAVRRAVHRARQALAARGATVLAFSPHRAEEVFFTWLAAISSDGAATYEAQLKGEPFVQQLAMMKRTLSLPGFVRRLAASVEEKRGETRVARFLRTIGEKPVKSYWDLTARRSELRRTILDTWNQAGVDVVICPPHATTAMPHHESADFVFSLSYMFRYSLLNFPAGVVPVTQVRAGDIEGVCSPHDRVEKKKAFVDSRAVGLPVGTQVVARPYQEYKVLAVMQAIQDEVCSEDDYPKTPLTPPL